MLNLPPVLVIETLKISSIHPFLFLLDLTLPGGITTFYLVHNTEDVVYQGRTYARFPFQIELPSTKSKGQLPRWTIRVSNATRVFEAYLDQYKGLIGTQIKIRIVNAGYLDVDHSELETEVEVLQASSSEEWVIFTCGIVNFLNQIFPQYRYIAESCIWVRNFRGAECAYAGAAAACDGAFKTCREYNNSARFGGKPGLSGRGVRLV